MKWIKTTKEVEERAERISINYDIDKTLATILLNRNLKEEEIRIITKDMFSAIKDPELLNNSQIAADRIIEYMIDENSAIIIRADYDVDGLTSGKIMGQMMFDLSRGYVNINFPERSEGYGLNMEFCEDIVNFKNQRDFSKVLLITVDNGTTNVDEVEFLKENGIEVIITDHHEPKDKLPNCIIVNPHVDEDSVYNHLAGCGVAFKVVQMIARRYDAEYLINKFIPYVMLGTIADMMPMKLENMAICIYGLAIINSDDCPNGIKAMKKFLGKNILSFKDIGWDIAPRLNSCGRMGDINLGASILFCDDESAEQVMEEIVFEIEKLNERRKMIKNEVVAEAMTKVSKDDSVQLIVINDGENVDGVMGIVANSIMQHHNKPVIVLSKNEATGTYTGSARSVENISMQKILKEEMDKGNLVKYGGHDAAAGLKLSEDMIESFKKSLKQYSFETKEVSGDFAELFIDKTLKVKDINRNLHDIIMSIPYDNFNFKAPIFEFIVEIDTKRTVPTKKNADNLWIFIKDETGTKKIWARGLTKKYNEIKDKSKVRIAGQLNINFMDGHTATIEIVDMMEMEI